MVGKQWHVCMEGRGLGDFVVEQSAIRDSLSYQDFFLVAVNTSYNRKPCLSSALVSSPLGLDISLEIILWSYSLSPKSQVSVTELVSFPLNFIVGRVVNFWLEMQGRQLCRPGPGNWMGGKHINPGVAPLEPTSSWPEFDLRESSWSPFVACS